MVQAPITAEMVTEAGIAADLAANPNLLPPAISELSDQAAIFAFDQHAIYLPTGANEPGASIVNAETITSAKIQEADQRDRNRSAEDLSEISAAGARSRESLLEMQQISVGGVTLTREEWDEVAEALQTDEGVNAARDALMAEGKTSDQANEIIRLTQLLASAAQKQQDGIPLTPEEAAAIERVESDPELQSDVKTTTDAALQNVSQTELTQTQVQSREIEAIEDYGAYAQANLEIVDRAEVVGRAIDVRDGTSVVGSTDLAASFDAGFSPSSDFNALGLDGVRVADAEAAQAEPNQTQSQPLQEFRV